MGIHKAPRQCFAMWDYVSFVELKKIRKLYIFTKYYLVIISLVINVINIFWYEFHYWSDETSDQDINLVRRGRQTKLPFLNWLIQGIITNYRC